MSSNTFTIKSLTNRKEKLEAELENYDAGKSVIEEELEIISDTLEKLESLEVVEKPKKKRKISSKKANIKLAANG